MTSQTSGPLKEWINENATYSYEERGLRSPGFSLFQVDQHAGEFERQSGDEFNLKFIVVGRGETAMRHGDVSLSRKVQSGTLFLSPSNSDLYYRTNARLKIIVLGMRADADGISEALGERLDFGAAHSRPWRDPVIAKLLTEIWERTCIDESSDQLFADSSRLLILSRLAEGRAPAFQSAGGLAPRQIRKTIEALNDLNSEDINLNFLAKEVGLSPFHFSRAFKTSVGSSPLRYRNSVRIKRACLLLETTTMSVTDVAFQVGYESSQALARVFMQELATTPSIWRRERRR